MILTIVWVLVAIALFLVSGCFCGFFLCGAAARINSDDVDMKLGIRRSSELIFFPVLATLEELGIAVPWIDRDEYFAHPPSYEEEPEIPSV